MLRSRTSGKQDKPAEVAFHLFLPKIQWLNLWAIFNETSKYGNEKMASLAHGILATTSAFLAASTIALADHPVPPYAKIENLKIEGNKCTSRGFDESFWSKGVRGERTSVSSIRRVCGTTRVKWQGLVININWVDDQGRAFTDCEETHQCWITLPDH